MTDDHDLQQIIAAAIHDREPTCACDRCVEADADAIIAAIREHHAIVRLPEHDSTVEATDDCNGYVGWNYPHGHVAVTDDGTIMWGAWHFDDAQKLRTAAAALLAAADAAERDQ